MERKYIEAVRPLGGHVLQVDFVSGSRLLLDMEPYLDKFRFRSLADPQIWCGDERHFCPLLRRGAEPRRASVHGGAGTPQKRRKTV